MSTLIRKADEKDTETWLRAGLPKGSGLPPLKLLTAQISTLRDALLVALVHQQKRYVAYIREHPPARPILKKTPFDNLPPGAALEWQTWLADVVGRGGAVEIDAGELAQALQVAARAGVGEGAISGAEATGLLSGGAKTLTPAQARKALAEVGAFETGDRPRQAIWQALNQASKIKGVRALTLRDGAGRIVAAASYRVSQGLLGIEYLGALDREGPGTGVQLMRELAGVAAKSKRSISVVAGPESEAFFSGLGMEGAARGLFSLTPTAVEGLAAGSFAGQVPVWLAAGWLEGPAARFVAGDGVASLVAENGSTLATAAYELGESGPLRVTALHVAADVAPGVERRMLRELATVAREAERGLELPLEPGRAALYERLGGNARAAWGVKEAQVLASGLSAAPGFAGQLSWELGVAGAPEWLRGQRIRGVVDEISATTHADLVNTLADGLKAGETTEQLAQRVMGLDKAFGRIRAERIARTEVLTANRWGALAIARAGGATEKEWHARVGSPRTRRWHRKAHKQRVGIDEPFIVENRLGEPEQLMVPGDYASFGAGPDNTINCFPGDTLVQAWGIERAYKRWYEGGLVEVQTALGHKLAGTPNHPVLTRRGWVPLGLLNEGDYLVCGSFIERMRRSHPNIDHMPALIAEVHDALAMMGHHERTVQGPEDFHGDGGDGKVDIVGATGPLGDRFVSSRSQPSAELPFTFADHDSGFEVGKRTGGRTGSNRLGAFGRLAPGLVGRLGQTQALFRGRLTHSNIHRVGATARLDTSTQENAANRTSRHAELGGQSLLGHSAFVQRDNLVGDVGMHVPSTQSLSLAVGATNSQTCQRVVDGPEVEVQGFSYLSCGGASFVEFADVVEVHRREHFAGHVYNLQTRDGWYIANGVVAHNCRCSVRYHKPAATYEQPAPDHYGQAGGLGAPGPVVGGLVEMEAPEPKQENP